MTIGERPNTKNIESLDLTQKVNILRLWRGNSYSPAFMNTGCKKRGNMVNNA